MTTNEVSERDAALAEHVPLFAQRVLVVGVEDGGLAQILRERKTSEIHGLAWDAPIAHPEFDSVSRASDAPLPFPPGYFDCIVFARPERHLDRLTEALVLVARLLAPHGWLVLDVANRRYWQAQAGSDPEDMGARFALAALVPFNNHRMVDTRFQVLETDANGCIHLGGQAYRVTSEEDCLVLLTCRYVFIAAHPEYDPLSHAGQLFEARHPDWAYQVLSRIPDPYLENDAVCVSVSFNVMLCQLALDMGAKDRAKQLDRFAIAQDAFYEVVAREPHAHAAYRCQAEFWHRLGNDDMAARLLRSVLYVAPDEATRVQLETFRADHRAEEEEVAPVWTPPDPLPRILFVTHPRPHYGLDVLYDGLCTLLGPERVTEYPWKPSLHGQPPKEMVHYPCSFDYAGARVTREASVERLDQGGFDVILFGDIEQWLDRGPVRQLVAAAGGRPIFLVDEQDECRSFREELRQHLGVDDVAGYFKREMLAGVDYGPRAYPLPFAYPDRRVPEVSASPRDLPLFWAGHRRFGLRRLYLERLESVLGRKFDTAYRQEEYARVLLQSRIGLNLFGFGFDTVRYWELAAHGCMLLAERLPIRIPHNFRDGESAVFFDDMKDLEEKLDHYLKHPEESARIAEAGYAHFKRFHTSSARARQALAWIRQTLQTR